MIAVKIHGGARYYLNRDQIAALQNGPIEGIYINSHGPIRGSITLKISNSDGDYLRHEKGDKSTLAYSTLLPREMHHIFMKEGHIGGGIESQSTRKYTRFWFKEISKIEDHERASLEKIIEKAKILPPENITDASVISFLSQRLLSSIQNLTAPNLKEYDEKIRSQGFTNSL